MSLLLVTFEYRQITSLIVQNIQSSVILAHLQVDTPLINKALFSIIQRWPYKREPTVPIGLLCKDILRSFSFYH